MTTTTATMTPEQAREFRAGHDAEARRLSRLTRWALAVEEADEMRRHGQVRLYGGPGNRDELAASILRLRGYTITQLNEATHVIHHAGVVWPDCPFCAGVTVQ